MAHELEFNADGSARMIYAAAGGSPWHKLGYGFVDAPRTVVEAGAICHATASVRDEPLFVQIGNEWVKVADRKAIVRVEDNKVLATVGSKYQPIQALDVFKQAQPAIDVGFLTIETMGVLDEGRRPWMQCKINNTEHEVVANDVVNAYITFFLSHDGTLVAGSMDNAIRVVCDNTLNAALGEAFGRAIKIRHTKNGVQEVSKIGAMIEAKRASFELSVDAFRAMARRNLNTEGFNAYIASVFADEIKTRTSKKDATESEQVEAAEKAETAVENLQAEILPLFEKGRGNDMKGVKGTVWGALNATTEYLTHIRGRTDDKRLNDLAFGRSAKTSQRAFSEALKLAA